MKSNKNAFATVGLVHSMKPAFLPLVILAGLLASATPFLNIYLGAELVDGIAARRNEESLFSLALLLVGLNMVIAMARWAIDKVLIIMRREINDLVQKKITEKCLTLDYQVLEKTETMDYITKAQEGANSNGGIPDYCQKIGGVVEQIATCVYASVVLTGLLLNTKVPMVENAILQFVNSQAASILVIVLMGCVIGLRYYISRLSQKMEYEYFEQNVVANRRFSFFAGFSYDYQRGKDVRIYKMQELIVNAMEKMTDFLTVGNKKFTYYRVKLFSLGMLVYCFFLFLCYVFVGLKAVSGVITIGELTLYVGALTSMAQALSELFQTYGSFVLSNQYLSNYVTFLALENEKYDGTLPIEKRLDNDYELEFRNVSFHYPNSEEEVLHGISAKIHVGRKMAIVGKNGSGKSTFIKLLCRLYDPTEGEILLNGIDIRKYDYDEYRRIFSVVFQDFRLFSFSVAQNVAAAVEYDEEKVKKCLSLAGIGEYVEQMEKGIETVIYKQDDEGVEISGGEAQKIAIARALYKDAPVVILDEPTAALDPVSELEIYERFDQMVEEKTAIYISHRMSSCRFCQNILVFDNGGIVQMGGHDTLVEQEGLYKELWEAQAKYYQNA